MVQMHQNEDNSHFGHKFGWLAHVSFRQRWRWRPVLQLTRTAKREW